MKNKDLYILRKNLDEFDYIRGKNFAYAVYKNKILLDEKIKELEENKKTPHPDYFNFENERKMICQIYSEKDENGNPILEYNSEGTQIYKIKNIEEFNIEYKKLAEKYSLVLEDMKKAKDEYDKLLEEESDIKLIKISIDDLPEDINANFLEKIKYMIE